jgi:hypothetical protein
MMRSSSAAAKTATGPSSQIKLISLIARSLAAATLTLALPRVVLAEDAPEPIVAGKLAGVFAGALLVALLGYALWLLARPLVRERDRNLKRVLVLLSGLLVLKTLALPLFTGFSVDLGNYESWALRIATVGPARTYQPGYFLDYPPGYLYALWLAGAFARAIGVGASDPLKIRCRR